MLGRFRSLGAERLVAILLVIFALLELFAARKLSLSEEFTLGPGAMPVIYAVGLLVFAASLAIWPSERVAPLIETPVDGEEHAGPPRNYRAGILTFAFVAVFIVAIYVVGFLGGTILFALLFALLILRWPVLKAAAFALIWGGALYYGFDHLLGVQLEPGLLFGS